MNRLRVLMTADTIGGVWTYALELIRALPEVDFALATMGAPIREIPDLPNTTIFESSYALEWMDDPWPEVDRAGEWLLEIARDFGADLIHLNGYSHAARDWNLPVVIVAHSCVLSWWQAVKGDAARERYREYERRITAGLRAADLVIAPTRAMLDALRNLYHFTTPARVIANARDPQQFEAATKKPFIIAAGRMWDEAKNLAALDAIAPRVPWPVQVAGEVLHPNGTEQRAQHLHSLGKLSDKELAQYLSSASIYALPARYEPFGLSALEAALSGCALVLGDIPSLREIWNDSAVFVRPNDHEALAAALNAVIEDDLGRYELARRARARALEFSPARMANEYRAVYEQAHCGSQVAA